MRRTLFLLVFSALFICASFLAFLAAPIRSSAINSFLLGPLEDRMDVSLGFDSSMIRPANRAEFTGLRITDRTGTVYTCAYFEIDYDLRDLLNGMIDCRFRAEDVAVRGDVALLGSIADMFALPADKNTIFREIYGHVAREGGLIRVHEWYALAVNMRLQGGGTIDGSAVEGTLDISLPPETVNIVPEEVRGVLFTRDTDGWMRVSVKVSGDFKKPRLSIGTDTFMLNIKEAVTGLLR